MAAARRSRFRVLGRLIFVQPYEAKVRTMKPNEAEERKEKWQY
jgi:hypothetical protein